MLSDTELLTMILMLSSLPGTQHLLSYVNHAENCC